MKINRKAARSAIRSGSKNQSITGGNQCDFVFDYAEKREKTQAICDLCQPNFTGKQNKPPILCDGCTATQEKLEAEILIEISRPRKVIRLHRCAACQNPVIPAKFSRDWGICKSCVADVLNKSKLARSNFIERAVNNFRRMLKGVAAI